MNFLGGFFLYCACCVLGSVLTIVTVGVLWTPLGAWALLPGGVVFGLAVWGTVVILDRTDAM